MLNWIRKLLTTYAETEKQLLQIRCLVIDDGQEIKKAIKTYPKNFRKLAMGYAYELAYCGYNKDEIINKLLDCSK